MITKEDLEQAIAECNGQRNPNANTAVKLAAFYTLRDHLFPAEKSATDTIPAYSYAASPDGATVDYDSGTEFARAVNGRDMRDIMPVLDELMATLEVINPRLYAGVIRRLQ